MLSLLLIFNFASNAFANLNTTQLKILSIDQTINCNRVIFEGSFQNRNTYYILPEVKPGSGKMGVNNYTIKKMKPNEYKLEINFYFANKENLKQRTSAAIASPEANTCDIDTLKDFISRKKKIPSSDIVIATLPINRIMIRLNNIDKVSIIESNLAESMTPKIFDFENKPFKAEFILNESEKAFFQSELISKNGIDAKIEFEFFAASQTGFIKAEIESSEIIASLEAEYKQSGLLKKMGALDIEAVIKKYINNKTVKISSQGEVDDKISEQIVNQLISSMLSKINQFIDRSNPKANKIGDKSTISIEALISLLKSEQKIEYTKEFIKNAERASAFRILNLSSTLLNDPNSIDLKLNILSPSLHLGTELKMGDQLIFSIHGYRTEYINYSEIKSEYLKSNEVVELNSIFSIPQLTNPNYKLENKNYNGVLISELTDLKITSGLNSLFFLRSTNHIAKFRWKKHEINPKTINHSSKLVKILTSVDLSDVNLSLSFGNGFSTNITFLNALADNPFVKAELIPNSNQIIITAKKNLGMIRIRGSFNSDEYVNYYKSPLTIKSIEQQSLNSESEVMASKYYFLESDIKPIEWYKSILLFVQKIEKGS